MTPEARQKWLLSRRSGVGGSDVAAILGVSPWSSPWDIWADKTGRIPLDLEETKPQRRGRLLEDAVCRWYQEDSGNIVRHPVTMTFVGDEPWMRASPDRMTTTNEGRSIGVEAKTARDATGWGESGMTRTTRYGSDIVPMSYVLQVAWSMEVMNLDRWDVAVLVMMSDDFRRYTLLRDPEFGAALVAKVGAWWQLHIVEGVEPEMTGTNTANAWLLSEHPSELEPMREATEDENALMVELRAADDALKLAKQRKADADVLIKRAIGDAEGLRSGASKVTWKASKPRELFDTAKFKADHPDVAAKYTKHGAASRTLRPTWKD